MGSKSPCSQNDEISNEAKHYVAPSSSKCSLLCSPLSVSRNSHHNAVAIAINFVCSLKDV